MALGLPSSSPALCFAKWMVDNHQMATAGVQRRRQRRNPGLSWTHPHHPKPSASPNSPTQTCGPQSARSRTATEHCAGEKVTLRLKEINSLGISRAAPGIVAPGGAQGRRFCLEVHRFMDKILHKQLRWKHAWEQTYSEEDVRSACTLVPHCC